MAMNSLTKIALTDIVTLLESHENPWPKEFSKIKKIEFLQNMLEHFKIEEDYATCSKLHKFIEDVKHEPVVSRKTTRRK